VVKLIERVVYPLDTVKTRLQALPNDERPANTEDGTSKRDTTLHKRLLRRLKRWEMLQMLLRIIKAEGLSGVFKGFSANMINTFSQRMSLLHKSSNLSYQTILPDRI
jgi:adenine nucleotide transporter 17